MAPMMSTKVVTTKPNIGYDPCMCQVDNFYKLYI